MLLFFAFTGTGCKNDKYIPPSDPKETILGKWEFIATGDWPDDMYLIKDSYAFEFFSNGTVKKSIPKEERYLSYKIDSLLHIGHDKFFYVFYEDKIRLNYHTPLVFWNQTIIYQRKK